jgi:hypothetical protein
VVAEEPGDRLLAERAGTLSGMSLHLILPHSAQPKYVCRVPTDDGSLCGKRFYEDEQRKFQSHVIACSKEHEAAVQAERPSSKVPVLYDRDFWDPEYEDHMRKVGNRMVAEGRMEMRPNER